MRRLRDRAEAGRLLAAGLSNWLSNQDLVVLALPRGGVPVAFEIATAFGAPLDVFVVRKLGVPGQEELAMGALASGGEWVLNDEVVRMMNIPPHLIEAVAQAEKRELERREGAYRGGRPPLDVRGRTVVLVDDGLATGATMRAAVAALRRKAPARIIVAVPVAPPDTFLAFQTIADDIVCVMTPEPFYAISLWYEYFPQTTDEEVRALLERANPRESAARP